MKLVEKTCLNPECKHKEELEEWVRFCPVCGWEMRPWESRVERNIREKKEASKKYELTGNGWAE